MMQRTVPPRRGVLPPWGAAFFGVVLLGVLALSPAQADEIRFRSREGVQDGTIVGEDGQTVTIRFPREAIESIERGAGRPKESPGSPPPPDLEERVRELERRLGSASPAGPAAPAREDAGRVEGVIRWKDRPLSRGKVMIVPAKYAGPAPASRETEQTGVAGPSGGWEPEKYETETDDGGRYRFDRVPPGQYVLYWQPDAKTGWVRRLREMPDLNVVAGRVTILSIPADRK